jgi:hypothetical protein
MKFIHFLSCLTLFTVSLCFSVTAASNASTWLPNVDAVAYSIATKASSGRTSADFVRAKHIMHRNKSTSVVHLTQSAATATMKATRPIARGSLVTMWTSPKYTTPTTALGNQRISTIAPEMGNFTFSPNMTIPGSSEPVSEPQPSLSLVNIGKYAFVAAMVVIALKSAVSKILRRRRASRAGRPDDIGM